MEEPRESSALDYVHPGLHLTLINEKKGMGYLAKEKIPAGTLLLRARPFVSLFREEVDKLFADAFPEGAPNGTSPNQQLIGAQLPYLCHALVVHRILKRIEDSQLLGIFSRKM